MARLDLLMKTKRSGDFTVDREVDGDDGNGRQGRQWRRRQWLLRRPPVELGGTVRFLAKADCDDDNWRRTTVKTVKIWSG